MEIIGRLWGLAVRGPAGVPRVRRLNILHSNDLAWRFALFGHSFGNGHFNAGCSTFRTLFRLGGPYFGIGTWVAGETLFLIFGMISVLGGSSGMSLPMNVVKSVAESRDLREFIIYWLTLGLGAATLLN